MAENEEEQGGKKKGGGWVKTILGMIGGLLSGVFAMYCTAWLDNAVKPAKPEPNFRVEHEGCTVRFQNLSLGYKGWWDFGDGTELIPADNLESVLHKYDRAGDYSVKLRLRNLLGEESERAVPLHVEEPAAAKQPKVVSLEAVRVGPGTYAPATYRITAKTENAPLCLWDWGDTRDLEAVTDGTASQEHMVMYDKPGDYVVELVAVNDTLTTEKKATISLKDAPAGSVSVVLTTTDAGTWVKTRTQPCTFSDTFRADMKGDVSPLSGRELYAASSTDRSKDWVIRNVQLTGAGGKQVSLGDKTELPLDAAALGAPCARNLRLQLSEDRRSVQLLGELFRTPPAGKAVPPLPSLLVQGVMTEELRKAAGRTTPMSATVMVPPAGQTTTEVVPLPPPPADWVDLQPRKCTLTVRDGPSVFVQDVSAPGRVELTLQKRRCVLISTLVKDKDNKEQMRLDLADASARFSAD